MVGPQPGVVALEFGAAAHITRSEGADHLAHREFVPHPRVFEIRYKTPRLALGDQPDASRLDEPEDDVLRAQAAQSLLVGEHGDDFADRSGVCQGGGGALDDAGVPTALLIDGEPLRRVGVFVAGVADHADDAAGPAGAVPPDAALAVGPAQLAVAQPDPEVRAVGVAAVLERPRDQGVETGRLMGRDAAAERGRTVVVLVRQHVEHLEGGRVHVHQPAVEVPVEAAHAVEGQGQVRVGGPVVRHRHGGPLRSPVSHAVTLPHSPGLRRVQPVPPSAPGSLRRDTDSVISNLITLLSTSHENRPLRHFAPGRPVAMFSTRCYGPGP